MRAPRPPSYWAVLLGVLLVWAVAARMGLRLLRSVEAVPQQVERALRVRLAAGDVRGAVADLEASRRGYALQRSPEQLQVLRREHERVHEAFRALRRAAGPLPAVLALVDSAEGVVSAWTDEAAHAAAARPAAVAGLRRDRGLLGTVRQRMAAAIATAEHAVRDRPDRRIAIHAANAGGRVRLIVEDSGPGVPPGKRAAVFEAFYTTKPEGEGTGLGLALCRGIATAHHGDIFVEDGALGGARFVVELPALSATSEAPAAAATAGAQ